MAGYMCRSTLYQLTLLCVLQLICGSREKSVEQASPGELVESASPGESVQHWHWSDHDSWSTRHMVLELLCKTFATAPCMELLRANKVWLKGIT